MKMSTKIKKQMDTGCDVLEKRAGSITCHGKSVCCSRWSSDARLVQNTTCAGNALFSSQLLQIYCFFIVK